MHQRCYNKSHSRYKDWGGRNIKVCERWNKENPKGFENYFKDLELLGPRPDSSYTIDRINNDKDYFPDNIRWADKKEQRLNQQSHRLRKFTYNGETLCMKEWAKRISAHSSNILYWIKRGKSFDWVYAYYTRGSLING